MTRYLLPLTLLVSLPGCMLGSKYQRPPIATPATWRVAESEARAVANPAWWEQFNDPVLTDLIRTALKENKDVRIAAAKVEQFVGQYISVRAALFPQVFANASAGRSRATERGSAPPPPENPAGSYQVNLSSIWQLDFFGKIRWAAQAVRAGLLGSEEAKRGVILTLVASVATVYVDLRNLDRQLELAESTAKSRLDTYNLFKLRFEKGVISELELFQAASEYEGARATIPLLQRAIARQENALSVLVGRNPGPIPRGKSLDELVLPAVPAGLPSALLANRPDIRQAEQDLLSANAQVALARSLYFPTVSLSGMFGGSSAELSDLFTGPARVWSYTGSLAAPVFDGGSIRGQVKAARAVERLTMARYEQVVQEAFREVEDALVSQKMTRQQFDALKRQVDALRNAARFARLRFDNGQSSYIEVLDAERSLFASELLLIETRGTLFQALVSVYQAMGGGWVVEAEKLAAPAAAEKK